jgi:small GTP-binding protein
MAHDPVLDALDRSLNLLDGAVGRRLAGRYELLDSAKVLRKWRGALQTAGTSLSVAVVGEFKAGKSTLINALLGREVAFVDVFEATAVTTQYVPDEADFAKVYKEDGTDEHWVLRRYLDAARRRALESVRRAEVHLHHDFPFVLVDTPGLGSLNQRHEERAEEAIIEADVLVWVIDSNDMFAAQEGAFLIRCREIGMPIILALGKADTLDPAEVQEGLRWLSKQLKYNPSEVILLAAVRHSRSSPDPGVGRLLDRLHDLARLSAATRARARRAKEQEALDESRRSITALIQGLRRDRESLDAEESLIRAQADEVGGYVLDACRERILGDIRRELERELPATLQQADLVPLCQRISVRFNDHADRFKQELPVLIQARARAKWKDLFDLRARDLEQQISRLVDQGEENQDNADFLRQQLEQVAFRRRSVVQIIDSGVDSLIKVGLFVVGVALTVYTGDIRLMLSASCLALDNRGQVTMSSEEVHYTRDDCLHVLCRQAGPEIIESRVFESIRQYVGEIARLAMEAICHDRTCDCSPDELRQAEVAASRIEEEVDRLRQSLVA